MKVAIIFHTFSMVGGASKSGLTMAVGLKNMGVDIFAVCPQEGDLAVNLRKNGIPVEMINYGWSVPQITFSLKGFIKFPAAYILRRIINRKAIKKIADFLKSNNIELVHTNTSVTDVGEKAARRLGLPHISHYREFGWRDCHAIMWHEQRMNSYRNQYGIAITECIKAHHKLEDTTNCVIYNGIRLSKQQDPIVENGKYFLFAGGLFKSKGIDDLIDAYAKLPESLRERYPLLIAGSTTTKSDLDSFKERARSKGIENQIKWLGERKDVAELMRQSLALIVPSHYEAFGRVVVEGMTNGTIVIGRNTAGIKEQFDNGLRLTGSEIGLRFKTIDELAHCLEEVCKSDTDQRQKMIERSQLTISQLYSPENYINHIFDFYKKVLEKT